MNHQLPQLAFPTAAAYIKKKKKMNTTPMTTGSPDQKDSGLCILLLGRGFTGSSAGKESACNAGDPGLILGS